MRLTGNVSQLLVPARLRTTGASAMPTADLVGNLLIAQFFLSVLGVIGGGGLLAGHLALADRTRDHTRRLLPDAPVQTLDRPPVAAAVALAHAAAATR